MKTEEKEIAKVEATKALKNQKTKKQKTLGAKLRLKEKKGGSSVKK